MVPVILKGQFAKILKEGKFETVFQNPLKVKLICTKWTIIEKILQPNHSIPLPWNGEPIALKTKTVLLQKFSLIQN